MITNKQIRILRSEAVNAGDNVQVALCDIALASALGEIPEVDEEVREALESLGVVPERVNADVIARKLCSRVIVSK